MPTITRWFVKTSLVMLVLALLIGVYQQIPGLPKQGYFPVYLHLLAFGWLTQLIFGIAVWMLPKFTSEKPRGYEWINWLTYISLNFGLLLRFIFEPLYGSERLAWSGVGLILAAILQWLAGVLFAGQAWFRVKGR
ncbi:MAG: hypothetical protein Kow002_00690 [Anaerolineales bacterium]